MTSKVKHIHIEKYDIGTWEKEQKPYAMILTDVIQRISMKYSQAFLMWVFLESLPPTWEPNKHHLMDHFGISERTYERHMLWLNTVKLVEYRQKRGSKGEFGKGHLVVLNGTKFNPDAESNGTVKIGGTVVNKKKAKVIHINDAHRIAKFGGTDTSPETRASIDESQDSPNRQITEVRSNDGHINTTQKKHKGKKKTNNPVTVFSDKQIVKDFIERVVANRQDPLEEEIIDQGIHYAYITNEDKNFDSVNKRINIFLKKVREGKWNIPQGWNGITSQSIRQQEENYEANKRAQYQQEAQAFRALTQTVAETGSHGGSPKQLREILNRLKGITDGKEADEGTMQKQVV